MVAIAAKRPQGKNLDRPLDPKAVFRVLVRTDGNRSQAARELGVSRQTLYTFLCNHPKVERALKEFRETLAT